MEVPSSPFTLFALDQLSEAILLVADQRVVFANSGFERLTQLSRSQVVKATSIPFLREEDHERFYEKLEEAVKTKKKISWSFDITNGTAVFARMKIDFTAFDDRQVFCTFENELSLADQLERLKWLEAFNERSQQLWSCNELDVELNDIKTLFVSKRSADYSIALGTPIDKLTGYYAKKDLGLKPEEVDWWIGKYASLGEHNPFASYENVITAPNGEKLTLFCKIFYIGKSAQGKPQFLNMVEDHSEQRKMVEELEMKRKNLEETSAKLSLMKSFFDNSPLMMGTVELLDNDTDFVFTTANPALSSKLSTLTGSNNAVRASHFLSQSDISEWIRSSLLSKQTASPTVLEMKTLYTYLSSCVMHLGDNRYAFLSQDISNRKLLEEELLRTRANLEDQVKARTKQLESAINVKNRFLAIMSHEIRTPLSGILGMFTLLNETKMSSDQYDFIRIGKVCGEQLLGVINDILDLTKLEESKLYLDEQPFDVREIIEESLQVVQVEARQKNLELIVDVDPLVQKVVYGDGARLRQILVNLVNNAVKFSFRGDIVVSATTKPINETTCTLQFCVKDEGVGISELAKPTLFTMFNQADTSLTRRFGGSGLGLSISKRLCELMHGKMWFDSTEGVGSSFYFTITTEKGVPPPMIHVRGSILGKRLLLVEKSKGVTQQLIRSLSTYGFSVFHVLTIDEAAEVVQWSSVDMVIIDVDNQDPVNCIEIVEATSPVMFFGSPQPHLQRPSIRFLKKPIAPELLVTTLTEIFKDPKAMLLPSSPVVQPNKTVTNSISILIAEDNLMNQKVISRLLNSMGYTNWQIVDNGKKAVEAVRKNRFDVILMDCMMPEMGGIEATEIIRLEIPVADQPLIIALTADAFTENRDQCLKAGMNFVVTKPIHRTHLAELLEKYAQKSPKEETTST